VAIGPSPIALVVEALHMRVKHMHGHISLCTHPIEAVLRCCLPSAAGPSISESREKMHPCMRHACLQFSYEGPGACCGSCVFHKMKSTKERSSLIYRQRRPAVYVEKDGHNSPSMS
jgi:hypothetical protein